MPLLRKQPFKRSPPPRDLRMEEEIFFCEATKEVFRDYEEFFQRTILCNSLVWSCSITGKANLTYEEAIECEKKARKRLGTLPKPLKKGLLWTAAQTKRGRIADVVDDVFRFAINRYFVGEVVEAVIGEMWCDSKILRVIPPTQEEIEKNDQEEREAEEEEERKKKEEAAAAGGDEKKSPKKPKEKKAPFLPHDYLFKYEVQEIDPDDPTSNEKHIVEADDVRREKGSYTREKNLLFLKNVIELGKDLNFRLKKEVAERHKIAETAFEDIFAGHRPIFEETKRLKSMPGAKESPTGSKHKNKDDKKRNKKSKDVKGKGQGTLDSWVKGEDKKPDAGKKASGTGGKVKKQTAAEIAAEMKKFQEDMRRRTEEMKKKKLEEKEKKKEEKRLVNEVMAEWKKKREDLECEDLRELPAPTPVQCRIPNHLFGDFLTLLQFIDAFSELLETKDSFANGVTFDILEKALTDRETIGGDLYEVLNFLLGAVFDLQEEEDEEVKLDKIANTDVSTLDKNILGRDKDIANQIKSATLAAQWPMKTQGVAKLRELHMDQWSITEILRQHLASAGAFRSERAILWLYQQRGGYRLSDDPGLTFRMEEPQILDALGSMTVYELSCRDKLKILNCLMLQVLSFATVRDDIEERYNEYVEAKAELRRHQISENKKIREKEEKEREKRKQERMQKKETELKNQEAGKSSGDAAAAAEAEEAKAAEEKKKKEEALPPEAHLTERQRLAIQAAKEKEEREKQKKAEMERYGAVEKEEQLASKVADLQSKACLSFLGRDRAYRRYWVIDTLPGLFVEHDDDTVGPCMPSPTPYSEDAGPMDEDRALCKVQEMMKMMSNGSKSPDEKSSSDKENDLEDKKDKNKGKKQQQQAAAAMKQKVLSAKNGTLGITASSPGGASVTPAAAVTPTTSSAMDSKDAVVKHEPAETDAASTSVLTAKLPWGACLADNESCPVHSTILPRTSWAYFSTIEEVDEIIERLNPRGIRESELADKLSSERDKIAKNLRKFSYLGERLSQKVKEAEGGKEAEAVKSESRDEDAAPAGGDAEDKKPAVDSSSISTATDLTLRDQLLELEEKIYLGSLGTLKVRDRLPWRDAIQYGKYDRQCDSLAWGGRSAVDTPFESRLQSAGASRDASPDRIPCPMTEDGGGNKRDSTGSNSSSTALEQRKKVRDLASAILQVGQMLDVKYLKSPLGEDEKEKKKRLKEEEKRRKVRSYFI